MRHLRDTLHLRQSQSDSENFKGLFVWGELMRDFSGVFLIPSKTNVFGCNII